MFSPHYVGQRPIAQARPLWFQVGVPKEHGGWSLTLEPVILGLLVSFSWSGLLLGAAAFLAFLARTPCKVVLVDLWRNRFVERTKVALYIALIECILITVFFVVAFSTAANSSFYVPLLIAAPLVFIQLFFDMRSKSRRLIPELAGTIGIGSIVAVVVMASGESLTLGLGLWMIISSRAIAAIPYVRTQMFRVKKREYKLWHSDLAQLIAVSVALVALSVGWVSALAFYAVLFVGISNIILVRVPAIKLRYVGIQQMVFGIMVIILTALSV